MLLNKEIKPNLFKKETIVHLHIPSIYYHNKQENCINSVRNNFKKTKQNKTNIGK